MVVKLTPGVPPNLDKLKLALFQARTKVYTMTNQIYHQRDVYFKIDLKWTQIVLLLLAEILWYTR